MSINYTKLDELPENEKKNIPYYKYINFITLYNPKSSKEVIGEIIKIFDGNKEDIKKPNISSGVLRDLVIGTTTVNSHKCHPSFISCTLLFVKDDVPPIVIYLLRLLFFKYNIYNVFNPEIRRRDRETLKSDMSYKDHEELQNCYKKLKDRENKSFENSMFITLYDTIF